MDRAASVDGLRARIGHHLNPMFRATHPSFHYTMMDLPGTVSQFFIFARCPASKSLGFMLVAEAVMIAVLALYELPSYLKTLASLGIPAAISGRNNPLVGLNLEAGLRFQGWDVAGAANARAEQMRKTAVALITTGLSVSISTVAQTTFCLLQQHRVRPQTLYSLGDKPV